MKNSATTNCLPDPVLTDLIRVSALFLSLIRFAVVKHGGRIERDPLSGSTHLYIPKWAQEACFKELGTLIDTEDYLQTITHENAPQ